MPLGELTALPSLPSWILEEKLIKEGDIRKGEKKKGKRKSAEANEREMKRKGRRRKGRRGTQVQPLTLATSLLITFVLCGILKNGVDLHYQKLPGIYKCRLNPELVSPHTHTPPVVIQ